MVIHPQGEPADTVEAPAPGLAVQPPASPASPAGSRPRVFHDPERTVWTIKHRLPGRLRVVGLALRGDHSLALGIQTFLRRLPGVRHVSASDVTGTVLIVFEESEQTPDGLVESIRHAHRSRNKRAHTWEVREMDILRAVERALASCDAACRSATRGRLSLRVVALYLMTGRVIWRLVTTGVVFPEALGTGLDALTTWVLFKHPRLAHELERVEAYLHPV
jgi:hypothetical protein